MTSMVISPDVLRTQLAYSAWASQRLVGAASRLTPDELNRDFQTADRHVLGTLVHVYAADRIWLARVTGAPSPAFTTDADYHFPVLQNDWPALHQRWQHWAAALTGEQTDSTVAYKDTKGHAYTSVLWQIVLHVVNHGSHHRGQVSGFLRAMGHPPPALDLGLYYREIRNG
ncbi:MAG: DinB family protein [Acidobacteriia bacterium]|nr:DinB family protein [Terriglobia bacterium]